MERGQCSRDGGGDGDDAWARLVPSDPTCSEIVRMPDWSCKVTLTSPQKKNWCMIMRNSDQSRATATIMNTSAEIIVVDGVVVKQEESTAINCGSKIVAGPNENGSLCYTFEVLQDAVNDKKIATISVDVEHSKCSICLNIWHDVVTIAPCLHNFCNGCFSEWLKRCQESRKVVICPQCRCNVLSVGRNHFLQNIEVELLLRFPLLKRPDEELALLDKAASIQSNLVLPRKFQSRKRRSPSSDDENNRVVRVDLRCPQCVAQVGGYRCNLYTVHLQCHACGGMMPLRADSGIPQNCVGCDRAFCGAYWQAQGRNFHDMYRSCSSDTFKAISDYNVLRVPDSAHQNNRYEQAITERCIMQIGMSLQAVIGEWMIKFNNREIDRTRMPLNHAETITMQSHLCGECYNKLVGYLLYWFRTSMPKYLLPPEASNREDCWYGYVCRTQHHNDEHAKKKNHVCLPTRGDPNAPLIS